MHKLQILLTIYVYYTLTLFQLIILFMYVLSYVSRLDIDNYSILLFQKHT